MICNVLWFVSMDFPLSTLFYWILLRKGFSFIKSILSTLFFIWIRTAAGYHCGVRAHSVDNYSGIYECSCWWIVGQRAVFIFSLCCSLVVNIDDWTYFHNKDLKKGNMLIMILYLRWPWIVASELNIYDRVFFLWIDISQNCIWGCLVNFDDLNV
jgi:hypothetical protein